jgi:hypothetical protein
MVAGRPEEYMPDFHPEDCIRLGSLGKFKVQMCAHWGVSCSAIDRWIRKHPEFRRAYALAASLRTSWLLEQAQIGLHNSREKQINHQVLSMMMRYDGQQVDERTVSLPKLAKAKTNMERCDAVIDAYAQGEIGSKELHSILGAIQVCCTVEQNEVTNKKLEAVEEKLANQHAQ